MFDRFNQTGRRSAGSARTSARRFNVLVAALMFAIVAPAAARAGQAPAVMSVAKLPAPDLIANASASQPDYVIGPLDKLEIKVYPESDLGGEIQVDTSGKIEMPLIGSVMAAAKTPGQLGHEIAAQLGAKYLVSPSVAVEVKDSASQKYTVTGAVLKPGVYDALGQVTLMQAIAIAQGVNEYANDRNVVIFRTIHGARAAALVDLDEVEKGKVDDPQIYPGDVIVVATSASKRFIHNLIGVTPLLYFLHPLGF